MAIDRLQEKIRKLKNPCIVDFSADKAQIPPHILEQEHDFVHSYGRFCTELLEALAGKVPGVRFSFSSFALMGTEGLLLLSRLLSQAKGHGFYVILDVPEALSAFSAQNMAEAIFAEGSIADCDAILTGAYIGSDGLKPYISCMKEGKQDLFVVVRTSNKTAPEMQDLLTGGRLAHMSLADQVSRLGAPLIGKSGYSRVAAVGAASSADSLRNLRAKYKYLFLLLDGADYPNANAKNCANAFDTLGHGAAVCVGLSVTAAWQAEESDGLDYTQSAQRAVERIKKNVLRYITIL